MTNCLDDFVKAVCPIRRLSGGIPSTLNVVYLDVYSKLYGLIRVGKVTQSTSGGLVIPEWHGSLPNLLEDKYISSLLDCRCQSIEDLHPTDTITITLTDSVTLYHSKESLAEAPVSLPAAGGGGVESGGGSIYYSQVCLNSNGSNDSTHHQHQEELDDIYIEILPDSNSNPKLGSTAAVLKNSKEPPPLPPKPNRKLQNNGSQKQLQPDKNSNSVRAAVVTSPATHRPDKAENQYSHNHQLVTETEGQRKNGGVGVSRAGVSGAGASGARVSESAVRWVEVRNKKQLVTVRRTNEAVRALSDLVETGNPLERYSLGDLVDEGASGKVYISRDLITDSVVAVKIIDVNTQPRLSLIVKELQALQMMSHSCIVNYLASYLHESMLWIVMEYLDGGSLTKLCENMLLNEVHIATIVKQILRGLHFLHSNRVIHRDIKSDNILVGTDGSIKITDFGFCAQLHSDADKRNTFGGTPYWMSPEVIQHKPYDEKSDIWSLGMLVIELLQGQVPYYSDTPTEAMQKIVKKGRPKLSKGVKISEELDKFLDLCLEKRVDKRATATDLLYHPFIMNNALSKHKLVPTIEALINKLYSS